MWTLDKATNNILRFQELLQTYKYYIYENGIIYTTNGCEILGLVEDQNLYTFIVQINLDRPQICHGKKVAYLFVNKVYEKKQVKIFVESDD